MPDILIVKDGNNLVPKLGVTDAQRLNWMRTFAIYDINADGSKSGPYGPTDAARESVKAFAEVDASGNPTGQIVTPSGDVVAFDGDGVSANTDDSSTISGSRQIKNAAGRITSILCTTGTSIALTIYDNPAAVASGRQIYSGTLSAGDVVNPADAWFGAGCYASFTGTASFVINTSESAQ